MTDTTPNNTAPGGPNDE